ncbi:MFS transporter [Georgenia yuyongxinii]|uniref:MFS transporter n=1 Tax=Georgenia yuyongxinii TaxID=2589797 RepID=A0A5B8C3N5_9MICO|nr:MFS transporter [Georgenia yuyongxinii]
MPLYPLYALLFADAGLSDAEISALFAIWSAVSLVAEVPTGMLADRFSRRANLVAAGITTAAGFAMWVVAPSFPGFAAGFALWAIGGALTSGAFEALLFDALAAAGASEQYPRLLGRVTAMGLLAQVPAAGLATALFAVGGYALVGWVSVAVSLAAAALAACFPEAPLSSSAREADDGDVRRTPSYLAGVLVELRTTAALPGVAGAVLAVALVTALDTAEEYFGLLAMNWGVPTAAVPLAIVAIPLAGAVGASMGGAAARLRPGSLAALLGAAALLLGAAAFVARPVGLVAVAACYGLGQLVQVVVDARLQRRIPSNQRATVTSAAGLGGELAAFAVYAAWAVGQASAIAALVGLIAILLPLMLRPGSVSRGRGRRH